MRLVLIIGSPGSGKSTLAKKLARITGLPAIHLDQLYWRPKWIEPSKSEWQNQLADVLAKPDWILDGNYGGTLPLRLQPADTVILLDLPTWLCLSRVMKRLVLGWRRNRPDMAKGCPERFALSFLSYVYLFKREKLPNILTKLQQFSGQTIVLRSRREIADLLYSLPGREVLIE